MTTTSPSSSPDHRPALVGLSPAEIETALAPFGQPAFRPRQIYKWIHHHGVTDFAEMTNLPKPLRESLAETFRLTTLTLNTRRISQDGTRKYLWRLDSGRDIESVFIPEATRTTICISSQVGCSLGCRFCATAQMGFLQNLTPGEIVEQVLAVQRDTGTDITNVVLMGMGEPFLNYPRVIAACRILNDPEGTAISAKKITISTVGIVPRIRQFAAEQQPFSLAISLHAAKQELRSSIMPVADKFGVEELMASAREYTNLTGKRITFEYVLLAGVNDRPEDARALLKVLSRLRCKLNLIPYNDTSLGFAIPDEARLTAFLEPLRSAPFSVTVRKNRGTDIAAACGQLFAEQNATRPARYLHAPTPTS